MVSSIIFSLGIVKKYDIEELYTFTQQTTRYIINQTKTHFCEIFLLNALNVYVVCEIKFVQLHSPTKCVKLSRNRKQKMVF